MRKIKEKLVDVVVCQNAKIVKVAIKYLNCTSLRINQRINHGEWKEKQRKQLL